jgi:hypothetical protein
MDPIPIGPVPSKPGMANTSLSKNFSDYARRFEQLHTPKIAFLMPIKENDEELV